MIDLLSNIYLYILFIILDLPLSSRNKFPNRDGRPERRNVGRSILSSILDSCVWLHDCIDYRADRRVLIGGYAIRKFRFRKKIPDIWKRFQNVFPVLSIQILSLRVLSVSPTASDPKIIVTRTCSIQNISNISNQQRLRDDFVIWAGFMMHLRHLSTCI